MRNARGRGENPIWFVPLVSPVFLLSPYASVVVGPANEELCRQYEADLERFDKLMENGPEDADGEPLR